ncbi:hypothetical protein MNBD_ALPHA02-504 [hydrothermal vent metagenome]|uniref:Uncharacterized protein n=1 Tax=hydrothermal vent metagenome TaxID=652676 RepID=A0A3B0RMU0_9ZZZZ
MKLLDLKYILNNDTSFSVAGIKRTVLMVALGALALLLVASLTFEGEYLTFLSFEWLMEYIGLLNKNWLSGHHGLFLHELQIVFLVTFIFELFYFMSRYMRDWKL